MNEHLITAGNSLSVAPENIKAFRKKAVTIDGFSDAELTRLYGVGGNNRAMKAVLAQTADGAPAQIANGTVLSEFLRAWLPGNVRVTQAPLRAEEAFGVVNTGSIETQTVVMRVVENKGKTALYAGLADVPLSNYNVNFVWRNCVTFSAGSKTGTIESATMAADGFNDEAEKDYTVDLALAQLENAIYWNGYNNGTGRTFGALNDPNLNAYIQLPNGVSGDNLWSTKTFLERFADVELAARTLSVATMGAFDPFTDQCDLLLSPNMFAQLGAQNALGSSTLSERILATFKGIRFLSIPQLAAAVSGDDAMYLVARQKMSHDTSTDDGAVISPIRIFANYLLSAIPNADGGLDKRKLMKTAGTIAKRPLLVVRFYGG